MDVLYWASKTSFEKDKAESKYYLCSNLSLHKAGDITLPTSKFAYLDESADNTGNEIHVLYWIEPQQNPHSRETEKLRKKMRKKYGYITLNDSIVLIPAKWFSGELRFLESPFLYGNQFVSERLCSTTLTDGTFCPANEETPAFSSKWKTGGELEFTISHLESMQGGGRYLSSEMSPSLREKKPFISSVKKLADASTFLFFRKTIKARSSLSCSGWTKHSRPISTFCNLTS